MTATTSPYQARAGHHGLVIIEGIMGSGKSTTMRFVAKALEDSGRQALAIHERADPHPVRATDELQHWFELWRDCTPDQLAHRALARWQSFVEKVRLGAAVPVFDGQLFHGDLTHLFLMDRASMTCRRTAGACLESSSRFGRWSSIFGRTTWNGPCASSARSGARPG
jgi:hypothetical protein